MPRILHVVPALGLALGLAAAPAASAQAAPAAKAKQTCTTTTVKKVKTRTCTQRPVLVSKKVSTDRTGSRVISTTTRYVTTTYQGKTTTTVERLVTLTSTSTKVTTTTVTKTTRIREGKKTVTTTRSTTSRAVAAPSKPKPAPTQTTRDARIVEVEKQIFELTNQQRIKHGLKPFKHDSRVDVVALDWSATMARTGKFEHRPDWKWLNSIPGWRNAAENILTGPQEGPVDDGLAREWVDAWMKSPGHRANILDAANTHLGVGVVISDSGQAYATQNFVGLP